MFWEEDERHQVAETDDAIVDLTFRTECRALPVDHAFALSEAIQARLPWFATEPGAGLHTIHGAESGNGWYRPEGAGDDLLYLSRRTRFSLRLPRHRVEEARTLLEGIALEVAGHTLRLSEAVVKPLTPHATLFARYVLSEAGESEQAFLQRMVQELKELGVVCKKLMCGRSNAIRTPDGDLHARSLMLADLRPEDSVRLQQRGLGTGRTLGCGLFIPHKSIKKVPEGIV